MLKSYGVGGVVVVAHVILVSAQVLLVLTLELWTRTSDLGLTIQFQDSIRAIFQDILFQTQNS